MRLFVTSSWILFCAIAFARTADASHANNDVEFGRDGDEKQELRGSSMRSSPTSTTSDTKRGLSRNGLRLLRQDAPLESSKTTKTSHNHEFGRYSNNMGLLDGDIDAAIRELRRLQGGSMSMGSGSGSGSGMSMGMDGDYMSMSMGMGGGGGGMSMSM